MGAGARLNANGAARRQEYLPIHPLRPRSQPRPPVARACNFLLKSGVPTFLRMGTSTWTGRIRRSNIRN